MGNWIDKMNEMFAENCYTDDGRVTVDYCKNADKMLITVLEDTFIISNVREYTDFELMMKCMEIVKTLYNK
jgi:hypothetical protein|nr:MAG TPA: hypothetical protein [Bacteriophage sp.]